MSIDSSLTEALHVAAGAGLCLVAWLLPRRIAGAARGRIAALMLDAAPLAACAGLLALATGRPVFAGLVVLALGAGFALTDYTMRLTLREPIVFSESVELPQVFTHPQLYLPFAGPGLVLGGAAAALLGALALLLVEPTLSTPRPAAAFAALVLIAFGLWCSSREPLLGLAAAVLRRLQPSGEPFADAAALGPFGMLIVHAAIARAERAGRRFALGAPSPNVRHSGAQPKAVNPKSMKPALWNMDSGSAATRRRGITRREGPVPIILVQCESFFDARRLSPLIPRDFLPGFDTCAGGAVLHGRLEVPGWGANTMRAEFAVLAGVPEEALGYDRFNPYYALARQPIESQVWRLRRAGYRTICLHPFDRRFFRRDLVMPALGFEQFLGSESLGGSRRPPYCPDPDLARHILRVLDAEGANIFIFAITMGNHGPWLPKGPPLDPVVASLFDPDGIPEGAALLRYLDGLRRSDEMLQVLTAGLEARNRPALLAFYGDHLPSLPAAFAHFGFDEPHSDYVVWPGSGVSRRRDLPAHELGRLVADMALDAAPALGSRRAIR